MRSALHALVLFAVACVAASTSCKSSASARGEPAYTDLVRGYGSGISDAGLVVARTEDEWAQLWARHTAHVVSKPDRPLVDFSRNVVVGVLLGERSTAGYGVAVQSVSKESGRLVIDAQESRPAPDAFVPQVVTRPYHFIAIRRTNLPLKLRLS